MLTHPRVALGLGEQTDKKSKEENIYGYYD